MGPWLSVCSIPASFNNSFPLCLRSLAQCFHAFFFASQSYYLHLWVSEEPNIFSHHLQYIISSKHSENLEKSLCGRDKPENQYLMMMLMMRYSKPLQFYAEDHYSEIVPLFQIESPLPWQPVWQPVPNRLPVPNLFGTGIVLVHSQKVQKRWWT